MRRIFASIRLRPSILDRYIFREIMVPFLLFIFFFTSLVVAFSLQKGLSDLLSRGVSPLLLLNFIKNVIIENLKLTVPISGLFGGILAAGRLSSDSEITAMRAAGISYPRIYVVFVFMGVTNMILLLVIHMWLAPLGARERNDFQNWIATNFSLAMIKPGGWRGSGSMEGQSASGDDIYVATKVDDELRVIQIRQWINEVRADSVQMQVGDANIPIGDSTITQIVHARRGQTLRRRLADGTEQRFLRLFDGFSFETKIKKVQLPPREGAAPGQKPEFRRVASGYHFTDFRGGFLDYQIVDSGSKYTGIETRADILTIEELDKITKEIEAGTFKLTFKEMLQGMTQGEDLMSIFGVESVPEEMLQQEFLFPSLKELDIIIKLYDLAMLTNCNTEMPLMYKRFSIPPTIPCHAYITMFKQIANNVIMRNYYRYKYEIQHRVAAPFGSLIFFLIALPLGLVVKRSGRSMSFALALGVAVVYFVIDALFMRAAHQNQMPAVQAAWLPNILLGIFGLYIMSRRTEGFGILARLRQMIGYALGFILWPLRRVLGYLGDLLMRFSFVQSLVKRVSLVLVWLAGWLRHRWMRLRVQWRRRMRRNA